MSRIFLHVTFKLADSWKNLFYFKEYLSEFNTTQEGRVYMAHMTESL